MKSPFKQVGGKEMKCDRCDVTINTKHEDYIEFDGEVFCENCKSREYCDYGEHMVSFQGCKMYDTEKYGQVCQECMDDSDYFGVPDWMEDYGGEEEFMDSYDPDRE